MKSKLVFILLIICSNLTGQKSHFTDVEWILVEKVKQEMKEGNADYFTSRLVDIDSSSKKIFNVYLDSCWKDLKTHKNVYTSEGHLKSDSLNFVVNYHNYLEQTYRYAFVFWYERTADNDIQFLKIELVRLMNKKEKLWEPHKDEFIARFPSGEVDTLPNVPPPPPIPK